MRIISKSALTAFGARHQDSLETLMHWFSVTKRASWTSLVETRSDFSHADSVERFTVFNACGNKYRIVTVINYRHGVVYIRNVLTHKEYDKKGWL